ncbi:DUF6115 domain-containing protein [Calditrichota bacterium]
MPAFPVHLLSGRAVSHVAGQTLVVLTFDEPVGVTLTQSKGYSITIRVTGLTRGKSSIHLEGLLKAISVSSSRLTLDASSYAQATLMPAGSGQWNVLLAPAKEPQKPKPEPKVESKTAQKTESVKSTPSSAVKKESEKKPEPQVKKAEIKQTTKNDLSTQQIVNDQVIKDSQVQDSVTDTPTQEVNSKDDVAEDISTETSDSINPEESETAGTLDYKKILATGMGLMSLQNFAKAADTLGLIPSEAVGYSQARLAMGNAYMKLKKIPEATQCYLDAKRFPDQAEAAAIKLALIYQEQKKLEKASGFWEEALAILHGVKPSKVAPKVDMAYEAAMKKRKFATTLLIIGIIAIPFLIVGLIIYNRIRSGRMYRKLMEGEEDEDFSDKYSNESEPAQPTSYLEARVADLYSDQQDIDKEMAEWQSSSESTRDTAMPMPEQIRAEEQTKPSENLIIEETAREAGGLVLEPPEPEPAKGPASASWDEEPEPEAPPSHPPQWERIEEMHQQGASVREIAETLKIGQDEVQTVINLMSESAQA